MKRKDIFKICVPTLLIIIMAVFLLVETVAIAEEARTLPGVAGHSYRKVKPGKEEDAIKWSKERSDHNRSKGRILARKYLEKTDEGTIFHWVAEAPNKAKGMKQIGSRKGDPVLDAIAEKYPDLWDGPKVDTKWQAIE